MMVASGSEMMDTQFSETMIAIGAIGMLHSFICGLENRNLWIRIWRVTTDP